MGQRKDKRIRREVRRIYGGKLKELAAVHGNMFKPKPDWIPMGVWLWLMGFFIKIK